MTYSSEVLADSPLAYWKLDEHTAFAVDAASGGSPWSLSSTATVGGAPLLADGGTSVHGDGTNPIATFASVPTALSGANVTLEAWVSLPGTNVKGSFVKVGSSANGWGMGIGGTQWDNVGQKLVLLSEAVAWLPTTYTFPGAGTYHVVVVRGAGGAVTAYVNGASVWSGTLTSPITASGQMGVGGYTEPNGFKLSAAVSVDNVAIFASALSSTRAAAHYNSGTGSNAAISADSPAVWLKLDETSAAGDSGATGADSSGNGRTITHNAAPPIGQSSLLGDASGYSVSYNSVSLTQWSSIPSATWMDTTVGLTVEARIRPSAAVLAAGGFVASRWLSSNSTMWLMGVTNTGKATATVRTGANSRQVTGTTTLLADTAYTISMRWASGGNVDIFLNGVLEASTAAPGAIETPALAIEVGRAAFANTSTVSWVGLIDEVSVTGSALSDARLAARHAAAIGTGASVINFTGTVAGTSAAQGDVTVQTSISGQVDAVASAQGDVTANAQVSGQVDAASATSGVFTSGVNVSITGQVDAASGTQGDLSLTFPLSGQVDAGSTVEGDLTASLGFTGQVNAISGVQGSVAGDVFAGPQVSVGVTVETGALTLLHLVALPGTSIAVGLDVTAGASQAVVPLPGISVEIGCSLIGRQSDVVTPDPRRLATQWRYVVTDLDNTPLGELTDIEHDAVEDGVGEPATMSFTIATDSDQYGLIKPIERQCQVWDGNRLLLRGPILPGQPSDDGTTITHKIHDPSWFWREGRRVITRTPQKNLIHNGDFKNALTWWTRGYDADSIPAAAPTVRVVGEDFVDDTDGLDPIKAAEIVGVESVTEAELASNAVFWPNLATFRPGGVASVEKVADGMPTTAGLKVNVIGHTANDGTGSGMGLSLRRAQAAAGVIKKKRPGAVITTKGVGYYDPNPKYPIDSQAQRRVVIQYDQTISGKSKQWMRQTVEVTQPKEARYPLVLTLAAMLKVTDDWSVPDANMTSLKIVARRKGVDGHPDAKLPWNEQLGVGSSSISDTDPVDRWIPQTAEATIPADGRPYLVDVFLYAPAALAHYTAVGLFPDEMLYFWGVDQASIFRGIIQHIQKPEFGYADLGVGTRTLATGIKRDREFAFRDLTPADTALDGLMGISRGIEWDTVTTPTSTTATTYYPRQGKAVDYVLALGANIVTAVPANTRDVGSAIIAQAQGLGSYRAVAYANDTRAFGGTLIQRVITAEQDAPLNELRETAKAELFWARSSTPAYWVDVDPDSIGEVLANTAKGDTVRLILDYPTAVDRLARIVRRQIHPDSLRLMVAFEEV